MRRLSVVMAAAMALASALPAAAEPTSVTVRAVANDAKLIGDGVGGAWITIRRSDDGRVLAAGRQTGGTGDTGKIMRSAHERGTSIYATPGAAGYTAELDLEQPTHVEITATGPLGNPQARTSTTKALWLVPGQDIGGDGVVLTLHGFTIEPLAPMATAVAAAGEPIEIKADITMLCGCPIEPEGLWDANDMTVKVNLLRDGEVVADAPLEYAGQTNRFGGEIRAPEAGSYTLEILASDAAKANFGRAHQPIAVRAE